MTGLAFSFSRVRKKPLLRQMGVDEIYVSSYLSDLFTMTYGSPRLESKVCGYSALRWQPGA